MRKLIAPIIWLFPFVVLAEGPIKKHQDPATELEFHNVYKDLRNKLSTPLNTSSGTITGQFNVGNRFVVSTTGEVTQPLQPSFLAVNTAGATDVTGDGTQYTILWDGEVYDQGSDFATNTFTAPVSGRYSLQAAVTVNGVTAAETGRRLRVVTSNRVYRLLSDNALLVGNWAMGSIDVLADMDANDTATVQIEFQNGTKVVDHLGGVEFNFFSGSLIN